MGGDTIGKVIDLTGGTSPVKWFVIVGYGRSDHILCCYVGDDELYEGAQWAVSLETSTIDRVPELIVQAKHQLAREMAVRASMEQPQSESRT